MRHSKTFTLAAVLLALFAPRLGAQTSPNTPPFAGTYAYNDANGPGTLTVVSLTTNSTQYSFQPIQVTLDHNGIHSIGSGVYHSFADDGIGPVVLLSFTLLPSGGGSFFFQGSLSALAGQPAGAGGTVGVGGLGVSGTYWPVASPQSAVQWNATQMPGQTPVNDSPALVSFWQQRAFTGAIGGSYFATLNTLQVPDSTATWSGVVSVPGRYLVEVFVPGPAPAGTAPRTNHAVYQVSQTPAPAAGGATGLPGPIPTVVNQQVAASTWIPLGTFLLQSGYQVALTDTTGEPQATRSVVADAVRLTFVAAGP